MKAFFHLSQTQLNLLETCPPQFQKKYIEQLISPTNSNEEEKKQWGNLFHLLMQQKELNLPVELLLAENLELKNSLKALIEKSSEILPSETIINRQAEYQLSLNYQGYLLTVIYDLLITYEKKAIIFDWKTYLQPENPQKLIHNWQTKLYLYVLAETSNYQPEDITMTYWFVKLPNQPQHFTINYNHNLHQQIKQDLTKMLLKLEQYLDDYLNQNINFPHRVDCEKKCPYYQYLLQPEKFNTNQETMNFVIDINDVKEISIDT